jgi:indolepyruvate ferredoxin oxidoreductase
MRQGTTLDDKYLLESGEVLISGKQALVRVPLMQQALDRARGWSTAGFVTGYRGSPLGGYDSELWRARRFLEDRNIVFQPGLNEDLAATAAWGTQQVGFLPGRKVDGVFAIWYGKGPGVDRSGDAFKHANLQGTEPRGGVLLVFGDDHVGKSSSTAHQSDIALAAHGIPILYPANVAEILRYGLAGIALSRHAGVLVGLKLVNETADATSVVRLDAPADLQAPEAPAAQASVHIRKEFLAVLEEDIRLVRHKLPRSAEFVRANGLDGIAFGASSPRFVIVTAGKAYPDVLAALGLLGVNESIARMSGIGVYKVALISPLEPMGLKAVCRDAEEVMFVEEKRPHIEVQAARILVNLPRRPRVCGKSDPEDRPLLPQDTPLDPVVVASALEPRLIATCPSLARQCPGFGERLREIRNRREAIPLDSVPARRRPAFCPGCPHSISTAVPEGSFGMTGIGCHAMAMFMPERNPLPVTHMGGEGANWLGIAPFTSTEHVFQNLGDGTYNHSGSLAIRAAVEAGAHVTYKILYNDAVAMTGGQPVEGARTVGQIAAQVLAEGVTRVAVVSDHPERFGRGTDLPKGVRAFDRDQLDIVQRGLRDTTGVTVLIYDQTCAAEKRRRRKRGFESPPERRIVINELVCEGCGDCSVQSNCLAIQPLETELGRKRRIDQHACNQDYSCLKGFCPSLVSVHEAKLRRSAVEVPAALLAAIPEASPPPLDRAFSLVIAGIGGTGVVTISAILGMAANLEGRGASLYDMTGLSQKGGAVLSHVRLYPHGTAPLPARISSGEADLFLACDVLAAADGEALQAIDPQKTTLVANQDVVAPAAFQSNPDLSLDIGSYLAPLRSASNDRIDMLAATSLAEALAGDPISSNLLMLGYAWQRGHVPLTRAALERAIELNGTAVALNLRAFQIGRAAAAQPEALEKRMARVPRAGGASETDLAHFIGRRAADLTTYQNARYAERYLALTRQAITHESALGAKARRFSWAVARGAFKLMAYKDEYEVARLFVDRRFRAALERQFEPGYRLEFHLAPPLWSRPDRRTGRPKKGSFGPWFSLLFRCLAALRRLRETPLDVFRWSPDRKLERALRDEYITLISALCPRLTADNLEELIALAEAPLSVRGFGPVKEPAAKELLKRIRATLAEATRHPSEPSYAVDPRKSASRR